MWSLKRLEKEKERDEMEMDGKRGGFPFIYGGQGKDAKAVTFGGTGIQI